MVDDVRRVLALLPNNRSQAADIILIVDESGSMEMEHAWITNMISELDESLKDVGVGVNPRNRFGLVGFGDDCSDGLVLGRVLLTSDNQFVYHL